MQCFTPKEGEDKIKGSDWRKKSDAVNCTTATQYCVQYIMDEDGTDYVSGGCLGELAGQAEIDAAAGEALTCDWDGQLKSYSIPFNGVGENVMVQMRCCSTALCNSCKAFKRQVVIDTSDASTQRRHLIPTVQKQPPRRSDNPFLPPEPSSRPPRTISTHEYGERFLNRAAQRRRGRAQDVGRTLLQLTQGAVGAEDVKEAWRRAAHAQNISCFKGQGGAVENCTAGETDCFSTRNGTDAWEPQGCYKGDLGLGACPVAGNVTISVAGPYSGLEGRCCGGHRCEGDGEGDGEDGEGDERGREDEMDRERYVCDNKLTNEITPLPILTTIILILIVVPSIALGAVVDWARIEK